MDFRVKSFVFEFLYIATMQKRFMSYIGESAGKKERQIYQLGDILTVRTEGRNYTGVVTNRHKGGSTYSQYWSYYCVKFPGSNHPSDVSSAQSDAAENPVVRDDDRLSNWYEENQIIDVERYDDEIFWWKDGKLEEGKIMGQRAKGQKVRVKWYPGYENIGTVESYISGGAKYSIRMDAGSIITAKYRELEFLGPEETEDDSINWWVDGKLQESSTEYKFQIGDRVIVNGWKGTVFNRGSVQKDQICIKYDEDQNVSYSHHGLWGGAEFPDKVDPDERCYWYNHDQDHIELIDEYDDKISWWKDGKLEESNFLKKFDLFKKKEKPEVGVKYIDVNDKYLQLEKDMYKLEIFLKKHLLNKEVTFYYMETENLPKLKMMTVVRNVDIEDGSLFFYDRDRKYAVVATELISYKDVLVRRITSDDPYGEEDWGDTNESNTYGKFEIGDIAYYMSNLSMLKDYYGKVQITKKCYGGFRRKNI